MTITREVTTDITITSAVTTDQNIEREVTEETIRAISQFDNLRDEKSETLADNILSELRTLLLSGETMAVNTDLLSQETITTLAEYGLYGNNMVDPNIVWMAVAESDLYKKLVALGENHVLPPEGTDSI